MSNKFDCSGWATRTNVRCSDGRTILENAFDGDDGKTVPVVWNHEHNDPNAVLGHALLEKRQGGVYTYISFNETEAGQNAKLLVRHKDVDRLSIFANRLKQRGGDVVHGIIREVSLVLAGANPEAVIDTVLMHSDDSYEEGYIRNTGLEDCIVVEESLFHADKEGNDKEEKGGTDVSDNKTENDATIKEILDTLTPVQMKAVYALVGMMMEDAKSETESEAKHSDDENETQNKEDNNSKDDEKTIMDVYNEMTDTQQKVVQFMVGHALSQANKDVDEKDEGGKDNMKHNIFDEQSQINENEETDVLSHSEMKAIFAEASKKNRTLSETFLEHGISNIEYLFPDAKTVDKVPGFIKRNDTWVTEVMNKVHKTPFARIKSVFANITSDEARAKGYVKGNKKLDEVFTLLKRTTTPTTVYKKQSFDRDDIVDITDVDVLAWVKSEMRMMLDEEIARAILVGDGRNSSDASKINEQNIRPIWTDDDMYTVKSEIKITKTTTDDEKAKAFIKACIKSREDYKGSGNPDMFISESMLSNCLLLEDNNGRIIYDTVDKLARTLRVDKLIPVPVMAGLSRVKGANTHLLGGIYVNLTDYNVGADKGGAVNMFDDFDIDYNAMKYLMETRCSGALTKPYAAVAIEFVIATTELEAE